MHLDDTINNGEPETRPFAQGFIVKKGLNNFPRFSSVCRPRVRDSDLHRLLVIHPTSFKRDGSARGIASAEL